MIRLEGLHKTLEGRKVLDGLDLHIQPGETMVVIGRSGEGKSVSLKHIVGLMRPDRGKVFVDGEELTAMGPRQLLRTRQKFGLLFQSGALLNWMTVGENVALPLREHERLSEAEIARRVEEKLNLVDMTHARDLLPSEISGGMKKRAGLARAIIRDPKIVMYDEPTSGLDPVMSNVINELVIAMQKQLGITSLVVTHDMSSAYMIADRIAMLYKGRILFIGTPQEVQETDHPHVQQFIQGLTSGPLGN